MRFVKMLAGKKEQNLFLVGDDDQSIYRFREVQARIMLHGKDFPMLQKIVLNKNYRSPEEVVRLSERLIS